MSALWNQQDKYDEKYVKWKWSPAITKTSKQATTTTTTNRTNQCQYSRQIGFVFDRQQTNRQRMKNISDSIHLWAVAESRRDRMWGWTDLLEDRLNHINSLFYNIGCPCLLLIFYPGENPSRLRYVWNSPFPPTPGGTNYRDTRAQSLAWIKSI